MFEFCGLKMDNDGAVNGDLVEFSKTNFDNLCRICLQVGVVKSLFADDEVPKLCQKINECASVQMHKGDGLPENICEYCICELNIAYQFKNQCQKADQKLRRVFQSICNNNEIIARDQVASVAPKIEPESSESIAEIKCVEIKQEIEPKPVKRKTRGQSKDVDDKTEEIVAKEEAPVKDKKKRPFKCGECDKTFMFISRLQQHESTHFRTRPYKCYICNKSFTRKDSLNAHARTHGDQKLLKCDKCVKFFTRRSSLQKHYYVHMDNKRFKCKQCNQCFGRRDNYIVHLKTHSVIKKYKCKHCCKTFSRSDVLFRHQEIHKGDRKFSCAICFKSYCRKDVLRNHLKLHVEQT